MQQPMPRKKTPGWKILLAFAGVLLFLGVVVIGGVVWWFQANKDRLVAEGKKAEAEGVAFAATHNQTACIDEGVQKLTVCTGFMCEITTKLSALACLREATPTPGLCEGVPAPSEVIKMARWVTSECERRRKGSDPRCQRLLQAVPEFCTQAPR